ncbi:hypothetical protein [Kitasatospora sp. NBC_01302]|uniref:hypothetical protein n=1 Tax=Kitasatospora sp. NBC_01302 TaxID=2903575 RepID=UPI002E0DFEBB|nr:hypothetical protein OG294_14255 [Kitasatospora sp. NBC_01302]
MTNHLNQIPVRCSANRRTCPEPVEVREPVPLCRSHGVEVALAIVPAILGTALANRNPRTRTVREPLRTVRLRRGEQGALAELAANQQPITRRTVAAAIRSAGGTCSNQRAADIARHFRTLRAAA